MSSGIIGNTMKIYKLLPGKEHGNFSKVDNAIWGSDVSSNAKVLYGFLCSVRNGKDVTDAYISKGTGLSTRTVHRAKAELVEAGFIVAERTGARSYVTYVGYSKCKPSDVKRYWEHVEDGEC